MKGALYTRGLINCNCYGNYFNDNNDDNGAEGVWGGNKTSYLETKKNPPVKTRRTDSLCSSVSTISFKLPVPGLKYY